MYGEQGHRGALEIILMNELSNFYIPKSTRELQEGEEINAK